MHGWCLGARTVWIACLFLLAACGANDALLLNIDEGPLQEYITKQLRLDASHQNGHLPFVLVHGMGGFEAVTHYDYFYQVPKAAQDAGYDVFVARSDAFQSIAYRAQQLAIEVDTILETTGAPRVHIIAHSQGGLDARYLISSLGYGDRVATLTTLATPHQGVRLVDMALRFTPNVLKHPLSAIIDAISNALLGGNANFMAQLQDLSKAYVQETFNPQNVDDPRVEYFSYAGYTQTHRGDKTIDTVTPLLLATHKLIKVCEGDNDGVVSDESARWGTFLGTLPADHWDEIGQLPAADHTAFAHLPFYLKLMTSLDASTTPPIY